jgi:hypothetical protein
VWSPQQIISLFRGGKGEQEPGGCLKISESARSAAKDGRIIFLQIKGGLVFSSNPVGERIWRGLADEKEPGTIIEEIRREFGVTREEVEADVNAFIAELEAQELVVRP